MDIHVSSSKEEEMIDITDKLNEIIKKSDVVDGICLVFVKSTTSSIIINENYDPEICNDILNTLSDLVPENKKYAHDRIDNNARAHIKSSIVGQSVTIPVKEGKLDLGRWQQVMFVEFDGPRQRTISVMLIHD